MKLRRRLAVHYTEVSRIAQRLPRARSDRHTRGRQSFTLSGTVPVKWLDRIPLVVLLLVAVPLGLAPFAPEPHLWEKLKMLAAGTLARPIDVFDLLLHGVPVLVLLLKLARMAVRRGRGP
jgi:hypothetical protein